MKPITIILTDAENKNIIKIASHFGIKKAEYLREVILAHMKEKNIYPKVDPEN